MRNQYTSLPMPARFWANVDKDGPPPSHRPELGPCWIWTAHTVRGYGQFLFERRDRPAHVVAWILTHGPIDDGVFMCHHCDVRACVRPDHLFEGDQDANMADMVAKGRAALGGRNGKYTQPDRTPRGGRHWAVARRQEVNRGSRHHNARITEAVVTEARRRYAAGGETIQVIADWAGVSKSVMHKIIRRKAWAHVE